MKKNKLTLFVIVLVLGSVVLFSCVDDENLISFEEIELSESTLLIAVEETRLITVKAIPENAMGEKLTWSSSDPAVAIIQSNDAGLVTAVQGVALGSSIISAKNGDGTIVETVEVEVIVKVESIALEETPMASLSETSYQVLFTPENATMKGVIWTSSDPSIATVDGNGKVTAIASGEDGAPVPVVITATTEEGGKTASIEVTISNDPPIIGILYCTTSGTGSYNAETITTTGADANINYSGAQPAGNYEHYEGETLIVQPGGKFNLSLTQSNTWSISVVWIDWNGDNDFEDDGELVQQFGMQSQLNNGPFSAELSVPGATMPGIVRMRVLTGDAWTTDPTVAPCGEIANSSTKDFNIEIGGTAYCAVSGTGSYNADAVTTTGGDSNINYSGGQPSGNYEHYTDELVSVALGGNFALSLTQSNNWSISVVWIDWNADGDFEDTDESVHIFGTGSQLNDGPFSAQIDVPASATQGNLRMRILTGDAWTTDPGAEACGEVANSSSKDFNIKVL